MDRFVAYRNPRPDDIPLFFYHIPKTAGTTATGVFHALALARRRAMAVVPRAIGMRERPLPRRLRSIGETLVFTGHCWFGLHAELDGAVRPCTVLRDPVDRVASDYLWQCRVADRSPAADDFVDFLDNVGVSNTMTRQLCGGMEIAWKADEKAVRNLESCFLVGVTPRLPQFLSALLTAYGGPTVLAQRNKEERNPLKAELVTRYADEIRRRNAFDSAVYAHAQEVLAPRADALLAGFTEPNDDVVAVRNLGEKRFALGRLTRDPGPKAAPAS